MEGGRVVHVDDFADRGEAVGGSGADLDHRVAPEFTDQEQRHGTRLLQHVAKLPHLIGRVRRDQHQPARAQAYSVSTPFRAVGRPDDDPLAGAEARGQRDGQPLAIGKQRPVAPAPPDLAGPPDLDQRLRIGTPRRYLAQQPAHGDLANVDIPLRREVGLGERDLVHGLSGGLLTARREIVRRPAQALRAVFGDGVGLAEGHGEPVIAVREDDVNEEHHAGLHALRIAGVEHGPVHPRRGKGRARL